MIELDPLATDHSLKGTIDAHTAVTMNKWQSLNLQPTAGAAQTKLHKSQIAPVLPETQMLNFPFPVTDSLVADMSALTANEPLLGPLEIQNNMTEQAMFSLCHRNNNESLNSQQPCEIIDHLVWFPFCLCGLEGFYPASGFAKPDFLLIKN